MILYEDSDWLAVAKPTGLPTHAPRVGVLGADGARLPIEKRAWNSRPACEQPMRVV